MNIRANDFFILDLIFYVEPNAKTDAHCTAKVSPGSFEYDSHESTKSYIRSSANDFEFSDRIEQRWFSLADKNYRVVRDSFSVLSSMN